MRGVLCGVLLLGACRTPTGQEAGPIELSISAAEIEGEPRAVLTLENHSMGSIWLTGCSLGIQQMTVEGWQLIAGHSCIPEVKVPLETGQVRIQDHPRPSGGTFRAIVGFSLSHGGTARWHFSESVDW